MRCCDVCGVQREPIRDAPRIAYEPAAAVAVNLDHIPAPFRWSGAIRGSEAAVARLRAAPACRGPRRRVSGGLPYPVSAPQACSHRTSKGGRPTWPPLLLRREGQAFSAFSGVTSTLIRWGLAVSAFGSVIVSTPRL